MTGCFATDPRIRRLSLWPRLPDTRPVNQLWPCWDPGSCRRGSGRDPRDLSPKPWLAQVELPRSKTRILGPWQEQETLFPVPARSHGKSFELVRLRSESEFLLRPCRACSVEGGGRRFHLQSSQLGCVLTASPAPSVSSVLLLTPAKLRSNATETAFSSAYIQSSTASSWKRN